MPPEPSVAGSAIKLPDSAHTSRPWRIHEFTGDFRLEDVWALPTRGDREDFPLLVEGFTAGDPTQTPSGAARALWTIRWKVGELLGLDDEEVRRRFPRADAPRPAAGGSPRLSRPELSSRFPSSRSTCSRTSSLRRSPIGPSRGSCTSGWVPHESGGYRGQMAVLVKPNGLLGNAYMTAIRPFRHRIVYPVDDAADRARSGRSERLARSPRGMTKGRPRGRPSSRKRSS